MTDTERGLLAAVLAAPADDTPRLVFADWLEEHGDRPEMAEFIRVGCELAGLKCQNDKGEFPSFITRLCHQLRGECRHCDLRRRCGELLAGMAPPILMTPEIPREPGRHPELPPAYTWVRGFIERVDCTLSAWMRHGPAVVRAQPVTRVRLTDKEPWEDGGEFFWFRYSLSTDALADGGPNVVPGWLARRMPVWWVDEEDMRRDPHVGGYCRFREKATALNVLSSACLWWAKSTSPRPRKPASA